MHNHAIAFDGPGFVATDQAVAISDQLDLNINQLPSSYKCGFQVEAGNPGIRFLPGLRCSAMGSSTNLQLIHVDRITNTFERTDISYCWDRILLLGSDSIVGSDHANCVN